MNYKQKLKDYFLEIDKRKAHVVKEKKKKREKER